MSPLTLPHEFPVRVYYEDTDAAGVVYYANYLCYLERAREEILRALGYELRALQEDDVLFPVRDVRVRYRASGRLGDLLTVRTMELTYTPFTLRFEAVIVRGETLLVSSTVECACTSQQGKLRQIPAAMIDAIRSCAVEQ